MDTYSPGTSVNHRQRQFAFARLLSSALVSQILISAASFGIGLILIRHTSDQQYGYFILASTGLLLLVSLQNAFFNPTLATRITRLDNPGRADLVGGLYREQRRLLLILAAIAVLSAAIIWYNQSPDAHTGPLVLATAIAALAMLHREYFRMVLLAHRRPHDVLRTDIYYVIVMTAGVFFATLTPFPAIAAILVMGVAALVSGAMMSRFLHRYEPWDKHGAPHILRQIAPLAFWSTSGAAIHWTFSQGYNYLAAATLDITAVAAIAATRLLVMPVNLLSSGVGAIMLPLASGWLHTHGAPELWRRLLWFGLAAGAVAFLYLVALWLFRDWIFEVVLVKQFAQRDQLLLLWSLAFLVMVVRDQLMYLLVVRERFRFMTLLTLASAIVSLAISYWGMLRFGTVGAPLGLLIGQLINVVGIVWLSMREAERSAPALA